MSSLIKKLTGNKGHNTGLAAVIDGLQSEIQRNGGRLMPGVGSISMESISEADTRELGHGLNGLATALESYAGSAGFALTSVQKEAAQGAALAWQAGRGYMTMKQAGFTQDEHNRLVGADGVERLQTALEAYDDASNRNMASYTVAYNMQAAQQDAFGSAFYPVVVVTRDQVGYLISVQVVSVMDELRRKTSGDVDNFNRKNIVFALRDPEILRNNQTKLVPVVRPESLSKFVDAALVPPSTIDLDGEPVVTAPLKFRTPMSLIAISQVDSLVQASLMDSSDAVDRDLHLEGVYIKTANDEVFYVPTKDLFTSNFVYNPQGSEKRSSLTFSTEAVLIKAGQKSVTGAAVSDLAAVTGNMEVRLAFDISGSVDLQTGKLNLLNGDIRVVSVANNGVVYAPSATNPAPIIAAFNAFTDTELIGFDLDGHRTNSNKRQRGDLLDITVYNQAYSIPLLSPITAPRPLGGSDDTDASDLNALIATTRIRASNGAVDELLRAKDFLARNVGSQTPIYQTQDYMGPARYLVTPFYEHFDLDLGSVVNNVQSKNLAEDLQQAIVNKIREMAYRMVRDSGWRQAYSALNGGKEAEPVVLIGCDQVIEGWLMTTGDFRTLGNGMDCRVVSTPNVLMNGKIIMTLVSKDSAEGVPNVLDFGNMAYQPELVLVLPIHRNGQNSKELTVQPSFRHITNLPIMATIDITGYEDVIDKKVAIAFDQV